MAKKAIHHFGRGLVIGLEITGIVALIAVMAWIGLMMRLAQGPLKVDFLTTHLAQALNAEHSAFNFHIGSTALTSPGRFEPVEVQMSNVLIVRADKTPILSVDHINVRLSKRQLLFGQLVPSSIEIFGPALRVIRWEDGHFTLNLGAPPAPNAAPQKTMPDLMKDTPDLIPQMLRQMQDRKIPFLGGLQRVGISDATVFYEDKILNVGWKSRNARIFFLRHIDGIRSESSLTFDLDEAHPATLHVAGHYNWESRKTEAVLAFNAFNPAIAAQSSEGLKDYAGVNLPLKGSIALTLDPEFIPGEARFVLGSDAGTFSGFDLYESPIDIKSFYASGHVNLATREGEVGQLKLDLNGPLLEAAAQAKRAENGDTRITAQGTLYETPIDGLAGWWPEKLAHSARAWVTGHLSAGTAQKATIDIALGVDAEHNVTLENLGGRIDFTGITVDYLPPLEPVKGVDGFALYNDKTFDLELKGGKLLDMDVEKPKVHIFGLDTHDPAIDITVGLKGPFKTAMKVLDSKPLGYAGTIGIAPAGVGGTATAEVRFEFPLHNDLTLEEVKIGAKAELKDVLLENMVSGLALSGGPMKLTVDNDKMDVSGDGRLGGTPVSFKWLRHFKDNAKIHQTVTAQVTLDAQTMIHFGVPDRLKVSGTMPAEIDYTLYSDGRAALKLTGDVKDAAFNIPYAEYQKTAGTAGTLSLDLALEKGKLRKITDLDLKSGNDALKGTIDIGANGSVEKASFPRLQIGATDVSASAARTSNGGYAVNITGRKLDISEILKDDAAAANGAPAAEEKTEPLSLKVNVARVVTTKDRFLDKAKITLERNTWKRIERLELDALAGGTLKVRYIPVSGGHSLSLHAQNAGAALSTLGFTQSIRGGTLEINAVPMKDGGARDLAGTAVLRDFIVVDAPALARLLNAISLTGVFELMNGKGIGFRKAKTEFFWTDRGMPGDTKPVRTLRLKDGETAGASMGLTFEGYIDEWNKVYDLHGTIIPVSDINKMVASIPLVGNILTGGGGSVFAATYVMKGPKSDPTVIVNPISVLAPGIVRKLFFE